MTTTQTSDNATSECSAEEWFAMRSSSNWSPEQEAKFEHWKNQNIENELAYVDCELSMELMANLKGSPEVKNMLKEEINKADVNISKSRTFVFSSWINGYLSNWQGVAAVTFTVCISLGLIFSLYETQEFDRVFLTEVGDSEAVDLPDGSIVVLNTNSELHVSFLKNERSVRLKKGEAIFRVAHNKHRPFNVYVDGKVVRALGTEFTVRRMSDVFSVSVFNGKVRVLEKTNEGEDKNLSPVLHKGSVTTVSNSNGIEIAHDVKDIDLNKSWTDGRLVFSQWKLERVVSEFNRYLHKEIRLSDDSLRVLEVSGVFQLNNSEGFSEALAELLPVRVEEYSDHIALLSIDSNVH